MTEPKEIFELLSECGIQEWILEGGENFGPFIEWFKSNITTENIYTKSELVERNELMKNAKFLSEDELQNEFDSIGEDYENIWKYTNQDVSDLEEELSALEAEHDAYDDLIIQLNSGQSGCIEDIACLEIRENSHENEVKKYSEKCAEEIQKLQDICANNQKKVNDLSSFYTDKFDYPLFMHQMAMEDYFKQCELFDTYAEAYMKNSFKIQSACDLDESQDEEENDDNFVTMKKDIDEIIQRLYSSECDLHSDKMSLYARQQLTRELKEQIRAPSSQAALERENDQMLYAYDSEFCPMIEKLTDELHTLLQGIAEQHARKLIYESNKMKYDRATQRKAHLEKFVDLVSNGVMNAEVIWILMQFDIQRVKKRYDFNRKLDEYRLEARLLNRRVELLNTLTNESNIEPFLTKFMGELQSIIDIDDLGPTDILKAISVVKQTKKGFDTALNGVLSDSVNANTHDFMVKIDTLTDQLLRIAKDGPTNSYHFYNSDYFKEKVLLEDLGSEISAVNEQLKEQLRQFRNEWNGNSLWRQKRLLWIWFLTEPIKVVKALKAIKVQALTQTKSAPTKLLSGIMRKQN